MNLASRFFSFPEVSPPPPLRVATNRPDPVPLAAGARVGGCRAGLGCRFPLYSSRCRFRCRAGRGLVFAHVAYGVMPLWSLSSAPASGAEVWKTSLACRPPWRAAAEVEAGRSSFPNKLAVVVPDLEDRQSLVLFFPCYRGGGKEEGMRWTSRSCRFGLEQILTGGWRLLSLAVAAVGLFWSRLLAVDGLVLAHRQ